MPARRAVATPPPLTDDDVTALRAKVTSGEKPRVVIRAASAAVAAGTRGNVIKVGNPKEGEFIVVRLGKDEVPFAPAELGIPGRTAPKSVTAVTPPAAAAPTAKPPAAPKPATPTSAPTKRRKPARAA